MKLRRFQSLILWLISAAAAAAPISQKPAAASAEARVVEQLVLSTHGLAVDAERAVQPLIEKIRADPAPYIPHLAARLQPELIAGDQEAARQAQIAAALLVRACGEIGRGIAEAQFDELTARSNEVQARLARQAPKDEKARSALLEQSTRAGRMTIVARIIVTEFADARDARLRDTLVERFSKSDYSTKLVYLQYLTAVTPKDPKVQGLLRSIYESPQSGFYRAPGIGVLLGEPRDGKRP